MTSKKPDNLNFDGNGSVSVPVEDIVASETVQKQVEGAKEIKRRSSFFDKTDDEMRAWLKKAAEDEDKYNPGGILAVSPEIYGEMIEQTNNEMK